MEKWGKGSNRTDHGGELAPFIWRSSTPFKLFLQDGHGRAVMSSEAWWLVRIKVSQRFDSPIGTH